MHLTPLVNVNPCGRALVSAKRSPALDVNHSKPLGAADFHGNLSRMTRRHKRQTAAEDNVIDLKSLVKACARHPVAGVASRCTSPASMVMASSMLSWFV